jgi:glutathione-regulated potassium-efflux system ancillary protein KefC
MQNVWVLASLWVGLALVATLLAIWFKISTALTEIVFGTFAQFIIGALVGTYGLGGKVERITFLAGTGAIVLTFLAGAVGHPIQQIEKDFNSKSNSCRVEKDEERVST